MWPKLPFFTQGWIRHARTTVPQIQHDSSKSGFFLSDRAFSLNSNCACMCKSRCCLMLMSSCIGCVSRFCQLAMVWEAGKLHGPLDAASPCDGAGLERTEKCNSFPARPQVGEGAERWRLTRICNQEEVLETFGPISWCRGLSLSCVGD